MQGKSETSADAHDSRGKVQPLFPVRRPYPRSLSLFDDQVVGDPPNPRGDVLVTEIARDRGGHGSGRYGRSDKRRSRGFRDGPEDRRGLEHDEGGSLFLSLRGDLGVLGGEMYII